MTTNSKSGKSKSSKSKSISAKSKDTTGEKSAEKRERVVIEKAAVPTAPTAVTAPVPTETAVAQPAPTVRAAPGGSKAATLSAPYLARSSVHTRRPKSSHASSTRCGFACR